MEDSGVDPAVRFKRRKTTHKKRVRTEDETPGASASQSPASTIPAGDHPALEAPKKEEDGTSTALKEALRMRKRPRDRLRDAARKAELIKAEVRVQADAPKQHVYGTRFVPQTGEVLGVEDRQMNEYVEASMAENNNRLYGWPIPKRLEALAERIQGEREREQSEAAAASARQAPTRTLETAKGNPAGETRGSNDRLAAGMGKLHEVDLGPDATARNIQRTEEAWRRLEGGQPAPTEKTTKVRLGRDGKPRRGPKPRNSEDIRRDQLVEAVLSEAKLGYFGEDRPPSPSPVGEADNDDAMAERFRQEFLESIENQKQRKPLAPAAVKGVKEPSRGPKLGGSRSARAAMRLQEGQASKAKR